MGRVRFRGRDWVKSIFLDCNVDPGSTKDVDPGTCLTWQNHDFDSRKKKSLWTSNCLVFHVPQNSIYVQQKTETHSGLKQILSE